MHSLKLRLMLALVLVVVAVVGGVAFASTRITVRTFRGYQDQRGVMRDDRFHRFLSAYHMRQGTWDGVQFEIERIGQLAGGRLILADPNGQIVADSERHLIGQMMPPHWMGASQPILSRATLVGRLVYNPPDQLDADQFLASMNRTLLLVAVGAGTGAVLLVLGLSHHILAPVEALTAAARRMAAGDMSQRVAVTSDDELGDLARAFNAMADGLARLEELRRNMVTDVAHELRTPLTSIRGYLEALHDGVVTPEPRIIDLLHEEALLLHRLVDDLQELSLTEAGQIELQRQPLSLRETVAQAVEPLRLRADGQGIALRVDVPEELPSADADGMRVRQVLRNLLENALTYTPAGGEVSVSARRADDAVEVAVRDTGVGIPSGDLGYVFERFYRADKSRARASGGAGLGLSIARQLVEAHDGSIWVESVPGEGSTFFFTLPVVDEG